MIARIPTQVKHLTRLVGVTDDDCIANLRMDQNCFGRLVLLLRQVGGLVDEKYVSVEEQVATFLGIIAHHKKNRVVGFDYWRSGQTVSKYVHVVLRSIIMLHGILLVKPEPVPDNCTDLRWKWFKVRITNFIFYAFKHSLLQHCVKAFTIYLLLCLYELGLPRCFRRNLHQRASAHGRYTEVSYEEGPNLNKYVGHVRPKSSLCLRTTRLGGLGCRFSCFTRCG